MLVVSLDVRFREQIGKHLLVLSLPLLNPKATTEVEATSILSLLEREDCTPMAWYPSLYAPRAGGAYDRHHRTAGIAGRTWRRGGRVAARGAGAAAGLTRFEDEISMVSATTVGPVRYTSASRRSGGGASRAVSSNSSSAKRYGLTLSWESRDLGSLRLRHRRRRVGGLRAGRSAYGRPFGQGAAAGGRRLGSQPLDPHPAGLAAVVPAPHERLDVFVGARARAWLAPDRMRTRQSRRRIVLDQRDGLCARPSRRL